MKDKIISGQVFMYRTGGIPATSFLYQMKEKIDKQVLQKAVDTTMPRYPYFQCKAVEEKGDYYLVDNSLPFLVQEEVIPLGGKEANYFLIGVCAKEKDIVFSVHHGLCDGGGILPFIKTVLYYYCTFLYKKEFKVEGVRLCDSVPTPSEAAEPYEQKFKVNPEDMKESEIKPFILPETMVDYEKHYRWRVQFPAEEFYDFSHNYESGISAVIALLMSEAISHIFPEEKNIMASLASNIRDTIQVPDTFKNCIDSFLLPYSEQFQSFDLETKLTVYSGKTIAEKQLKKVIPRFVRSQMLPQYLSQCPDLESKRQMMKFTDELAVNTFLVSYPGKLNLGEIEQYIAFSEVYGSGTNGLIIEVMSVNDIITLSVMQNFETANYVDEFVAVASTYGLTAKVENLGEFATPRCVVE